MMNEATITLSGNLTRDPERKTSTRNGRDFAVVPIAVNRRQYDAAQGGWVTADTLFVDLLAFGHKGATALSSFKKGDPVLAHGRLSLREWRTDSGSGATLCVDVDSLGHDVAHGVSRFSKGRVPYDPDRVKGYHPAAGQGEGAAEDGAGAPGGADLVSAAADRAPQPVADGGGGVDEGLGAGPDSGAHVVAADADIEADEDGVVSDDEQADAVLARTA